MRAFEAAGRLKGRAAEKPPTIPHILMSIKDGWLAAADSQGCRCGSSRRERTQRWRRSRHEGLRLRRAGEKALEDRPKPEIRGTSDALVKIVKTTLCGTDLHILKGDVPTRTPGRILGHEGVGVIDSVGAGMTTLKAGDRVLISCISCISLCGKRDYCRRGMTTTALR